MSLALIERLRYEGESDSLDFKQEQYRFSGADDRDKSELLKDILAFANSWRRTDAYIVIGAREIKGRPAEIVGISSHLEDAQIQQFVNAKTQRPVRFSYSAVTVEGKEVGIILIPLQDRPVFLTRSFGKLEADKVYVRRGSSTAVARPDEVARMGHSGNPAHDIDLDVFFADPDSRERIEPLVRSHVLELPPKDSIPDYKLRDSSHFGLVSGRQARAGYYRELVSYTSVNRLVSPIWVAIENRGATTAQDVRLEVSISDPDGRIKVLDAEQYPELPQSETNLYELTRYSLRSPVMAAVTVTRVGATWVVSAQADKVQPKSTEWFYDPFYLGAAETREVACSVRVSADNLRDPHRQALSVPVEATLEKVDLKRIIELEAERFERSPEHQRFLRERRLDED